MDPSIPRKKSIKILYVDDEPSLLEVAKAYLELRDDFKVDVCNKPDKALSWILESDYDAIISDYQMPVVDGIELLKSVRESNIDIPFILFTGRGREEVAINALNAGADFYVQKGGDAKTQFAELINSIRTCVSGHRARCDLRLSESSLKTMADNMNDPVVILDHDSCILYANPAFTRVLGYSSGAIVGTSFSAISVDVERPWQNNEDLVLLREDGRQAILEVSVSEIMYHGELADLLILHDVTEKRLSEKSLSEAHSKMVSMFDSMLDPIYVSDMDDYTILYANRSLLDISGHDIVGRKCYEVLQGKSAPCDFCTNPIIRDESKRPHVWEHRNEMHDHHFRVIDNVIKWPDGRDVRFEIAFDVTEMKRAEQRAEESSMRYKTILKTVPDTLFTINRQGIITDYKPPSEGNRAVTRKEAIGADIRTLMGEENAAGLLETMDRAFVSGTVETYQYSHDSGEGPKHYTARLSRLSDDEVLTVASDVSSLRLTMDRMEESERLHRALFEHAPIAVKVHELDTLELVYANPKALEYLGYGNVEHLKEDGMPWASPPFSKQEAMDITSELLIKGELEFDWLTARKDGSTFWERVNLVLLPYMGRRRLLNFSYDITATMESFNELFKSQERYKALIASSNTGVWEYDMVNDVLWTSDEYFTMLGHDPTGFGDRENRITRWVDLMHPDDRVDAERIFREYCADPGDRMYENIFRLTRRDGGWSWILSRGRALKDECGDPTGIIVGSHIDITPMRDIENELRETNHRYETLANTGKAIIYTTDMEGYTDYVNAIGSEFTGTTTRDLLGYGWLEYTHPDDLDETQSIHAEGLSKKNPFTIRFRLRRHDGVYRWMLNEGIPRYDSEDNFIGYIGHCMDIDDIMSLEEALNKTNEKLKLMTGITRHDIQNQLVVLSGFIELSRETACSDDIVHNLDMMQRAVDAIHNHIEFTRDYEAVGSREPVWQPFNIAGSVKTGVRVETKDGFKGLEVLADPLLDRALKNIIENSINHGVEVTTIVFDQNTLEDGTLVLGIEDDGIGVRPECKERIFERGFGRNHGMGLFLIRQILSITGMEINEVGEYGTGARFEIVIPPGSYRFK